ncbi:MAG: class I SAM-dependent methyltransferase [Candidatus Thermoplasmatota archaeon]|nr:class I SAM-dependent methyltransferase [Candidatus Thermoplasmatota archaeon]
MRGISNRHWCKLGLRIFNLYLNQKHPSRDFVESGYNEVASFYDTYWTPYMSQYSLDMLKKLNPAKGGDCLDLTCGTGFVTQSLFEMTHGHITGVDVSEAMIAVAQQKYADTCQFIIDDVYNFLKTQPSNTYDCITCAWGFGYVTPRSLKEITRVLRPGGKLGIIDNSIFSNWEFVWFFLVALAEQPASLRATFEPHFFLFAGTLAQRLRMNGLRIIDTWNGKKIFEVKSTATALEQLIKSGVTAGILQLVDDNQKDQLMTRIGELFEAKYQQRKNIPIIHRYLAVIGEKR